MKRFPLQLLPLVLVPLLAGVLTGCDSGETVDSPPVKPSTQAQYGVEVTSVAPLIARHPTHIAIDSRSNIYWVQETDSGDDLVFGINESGVPEVIAQLTSRRMLDLLKQPGGSGNIQSISFGPDEKLYVYFLGGTARNNQTVAALVQYTPATRSLRLIADTAQLMTDSKMGKSLDLARGTLLSSPSDQWLWLRNTDAYVLLRVTIVSSLAKPAELKQPFESIIIPAPAPKSTVGRPVAIEDLPKPSELKLTSDLEDLSAADRHMLYYVDRRRGAIWQIDPTGAATVSHNLQGVPEQSSSAQVDAKGKMHLMVGVGEPINVPDAGDQNLAITNVSFPALFTFDGVKPADKLTVIPRLQIKMPMQIPLEPMQITSWTPDRVPGTYVAFDAASGELLRFKLLRE